MVSLYFPTAQTASAMTGSAAIMEREKVVELLINFKTSMEE
jgi:hypothetical protein